MQLTGEPFYYVLILAVIASIVLTLLLWGRVRGVPVARIAQRLLLLVLCQVCAIALTATWVNNHYGLYASWSDLMGSSNSSALVMAGPNPQTAKFTRSMSGTETTYFRGPKSQLAGPVYVWVPPQYREQSYRQDRFPVITLLAGVPGVPQDWILKKSMLHIVESMMADGSLKPSILVMPDLMPGGANTDCSNTPQAKVATWLSQDVPNLIRRHFRVLKKPSGWAVTGYSTGGFCALKLPMQFPKIFGIGAGMDSDPVQGDSTVLADSTLRRVNSPLYLAGKRPDVRLFAATSAQDRWSPPSNIERLRAAIHKPTTLAPAFVLPNGGHNGNTWSREEPELFLWMNSHLASPSHKV